MSEPQDTIEDYKSVTEARDANQPPVHRKDTMVTGLPNLTRLGFLSIAMLVIVSTAAGFLGGWLGAGRGADISQSVQRQQVVLKTQGQLISNIAKNVGSSVVSVQVEGTTTVSNGFF